MSLGSLQLDRSSDVSDFMQICAERVFALEDLGPALSYPTRQGLISVFVCADSEHLAEFFSSHSNKRPQALLSIVACF